MSRPSQRHPLLHHDTLCVTRWRVRNLISAPNGPDFLSAGARAPGADVEAVRGQLLTKLSGVEVLTPALFRERSRNFGCSAPGAGAALSRGALLGAIVGTVIVAQTLYSAQRIT